MTPPIPTADSATLNAYLDGELSEDDVGRVEAQLTSDVGARVLLKSLTVQREALATRYTLPVDCPVTKALMAKVLKD
jgi:anti-sigma factor RsiW